MGSQCKYAARNTRGLTSTMSLPQPSASSSMSKKVASLKKTKTMASTSNPSYRTMITNALHATKERKGLSRPAIMKYLVGASIVPNTGLLNKMLKKMSDEGKVVPGAEVGKSGSGCFKLSPEEKMRLLQIEKAALKKEISKAKGSEDVKKVSKKSGPVAKKSSEIAKRSAKGGKGTKAVKSKLKSSSSKAMTSKESGSAKKKALGAKPKKSVKSQGAAKVKKVAKQAKK